MPSDLRAAQKAFEDFKRKNPDVLKLGLEGFKTDVLSLSDDEVHMLHKHMTDLEKYRQMEDEVERLQKEYAARMPSDDAKRTIAFLLSQAAPGALQASDVPSLSMTPPPHPSATINNPIRDAWYQTIMGAEKAPMDVPATEQDQVRLAIMKMLQPYMGRR